MNNIRKQRIESQLRKEISFIIMEDLKDPRVKFVSVTRANLTNDLRIAYINVSIMGTEEEKKEVMKGLKSACGFIRKEIGERMRLRYTPELKFSIDDSYDIQMRIEQILKTIKDEHK